MAPRSSAALQGELFPPTLSKPAPPLPEGFAYHDDLIAPAEERDLVRHLQDLPFQPYDFHGFLAKRRVVAFGWRYDYDGARLRESAPIPDFLLQLRDKAAAFAGLDAAGLEQVLINEYAPGAGIGWHRDKKMFGDVVAISLGSSALLRLRLRQGERWERAAQEIRPRSAYLLRGPARQAWEHSIAPLDTLRYSVTFRNLVAG